MLRHILYDVDFFPDDGTPLENSRERVLCLLEALVWCDRLYLREHPDTPLLYQSGVKYTVPEQFVQADLPEVAVVREYLMKRGAPASVTEAFRLMADQLGAGEHFREIGRIIENGGGDCDNLSCWRVAELRELGISAKPYITWRKRVDGGTTYHVIVMWPDGTSEDPSLLCGMGGDARADERLEEERKLGERTGDYLRGLVTGRPAESVFGAQPGYVSQVPSDFGKGPMYSPTFWTDDAYESWSPTRPQAYYYNPLYPGGNIQQSGPLFNTRMRDPDELDDGDDRFDGLARGARGLRARRFLKRLAA